MSQPGCIYDISPPITPSLKVWPGDTPMIREVLRDMKKGDNLTLSTIRTTVHLGAHADAPSHYAKKAQAIHRRDIHFYMGKCQVVRARTKRGRRLTPESVKAPIQAPRVLFYTGSFPNPNRFNKDFATFTPELIDFLHERGVCLVGIDTPSADSFNSKELPSHKRILRYDMAILEGIVLKDVPEGIYELIALPLRLVGFDASPVRAILRRWR